LVAASDLGKEPARSGKVAAAYSPASISYTLVD
jgi:hypothetical protein